MKDKGKAREEEFLKSLSIIKISFCNASLHSSIFNEKNPGGFPDSLIPGEMQVVRFMPPEPKGVNFVKL